MTNKSKTTFPLGGGLFADDLYIHSEVWPGEYQLPPKEPTHCGGIRLLYKPCLPSELYKDDPVYFDHRSKASP
jgi:hypothetical protein